MKKLLLLITLLSTSAFATTIEVKVPGMVCQMCVQGMKKAFKKYVANADKDILVDLDTKIVTLTPNTEITDEQIKSGVKDAGYNADEINRKK
ncbi:heavy-metal-associated domain-containing protein [bacterium]|nr:heavy-metal-associated domain-containing protein [bacterium]